MIFVIALQIILIGFWIKGFADSSKEYELYHRQEDLNWVCFYIFLFIITLGALFS